MSILKNVINCFAFCEFRTNRNSTKKTFIFIIESRIEKIDENENVDDQIDNIVIINDFFEQLKQQINVEKIRTNITNFFVDKIFFITIVVVSLFFFKKMKFVKFDI